MSPIFIIIISGLMIIIIGLTIKAAVTGAPYCPTPKELVAEIFAALGPIADKKFYDLGAGDGRFLIEADRRGAKASGFEIFYYPYLVSRFKIFIRRSKAKVYFGDYRHKKLTDADIIIALLLPSIMPALMAQIKKGCAQGTIIVTFGYQDPELTPVHSIPAIRPYYQIDFFQL